MRKRYDLNRSDNYMYTGRISYVCSGSGTLHVYTGFPVTRAMAGFATIPFVQDEEMSSSSSSSSSSSISSSSSSYNCRCNYPICSGAGCSDFSDWVINGANQSNTDNCVLYLEFASHLADSEYIRLYTNAARTLMYKVATGTAPGGGGGVTLVQVGGSGLSGSVNWDGIQVDDVTCYLTCTSVFSSSFESSESSESESSVSSSSESEIISGLPRIYVSGYTSTGFYVTYENISPIVGYIEFSYSAV
jgi:hypothetical protein